MNDDKIIYTNYKSIFETLIEESIAKDDFIDICNSNKIRNIEY